MAEKCRYRIDDIPSFSMNEEEFSALFEAVIDTLCDYWNDDDEIIRREVDESDPIFTYIMVNSKVSPEEYHKVFSIIKRRVMDLKEDIVDAALYRGLQLDHVTVVRHRSFIELELAWI